MKRTVSIPAMLWRLAKGAGVAALGRGIASRWPFPVLVTLEGGRQMYVDLRSSIGRGLFATGTFDIEAIRPALVSLSPGSTFIDVGANIGFYSVLARECVGINGNVFCFEIDPRPIRVLRKTIAKFSLSNIHLVEAAVSDIDGTVTFMPMGEHGHNRIEQGSGLGRAVRSVRLDTWVSERNISRVDVIKIDVEGGEKLVVDGARETIKKFKPLLLCEADEKTAGAFGYTPADLEEQINSLGYTSQWLEGVFTPTLLARPKGK